MNAPAYSTLHPVPTDELPVYPLDETDRLDSHWFLAWERRRWLNSEMRLKATPECRALYFDLICISYDQSPIGTLPDDVDILAKLLLTEAQHLAALCGLRYGPLHKWERCLCGTEVRLMHPMVLKTLREAISRKEDNRARTEAANSKKRRQRLRDYVAGFHVELAKMDAAILWMDEWLNERTQYRNRDWVRRAIDAWSAHAIQLGTERRGART
jgi:hypothetical protein